MASGSFVRVLKELKLLALRHVVIGQVLYELRPGIHAVTEECVERCLLLLIKARN